MSAATDLNRDIRSDIQQTGMFVSSPTQNKVTFLLGAMTTGAVMGGSAGAALGPIGMIAGAVAGAVVGALVALAVFAIEARRAKGLKEKEVSVQQEAAPLTAQQLVDDYMAKGSKEKEASVQQKAAPFSDQDLRGKILRIALEDGIIDESSSQEMKDRLCTAIIKMRDLNPIFSNLDLCIKILRDIKNESKTFSSEDEVAQYMLSKAVDYFGFKPFA